MTLQEIEQELRAMAGEDVELEHARADDLLIEAIRFIIPDHAKEEAERLISAYEDVPKWFA